MTKLLEPKIVLYDIETLPCEGTFWGPGYNQTVSYAQIDQHAVIACAAWKVLGEDYVYYTDALKFKKAPKESRYKYTPDDRQVCIDIAKGLADADILVAHNGDKFDIRWINARCFYHNIGGVQYHKSIDTLKVARKELRLPSNKLDDISDYANIPGKIKTDYNLWLRVLSGEKKAYQEMLEYCRVDVETLEANYLRLEQYNTRPIQSNQIESADAPCPFCGSTHKQSRGRRLNQKTWRKIYHCQGCRKSLVGPLQKYE